MAVKDSPISKLTQTNQIHTKAQNGSGSNISADLLLISQYNTTTGKYESKGIDYDNAMRSILSTATNELSGQLSEFIHDNSCVKLCRWKRVVS